MNEKEFLSKYDSAKYEKPSVAVDISIFSLFDEKCTNYRKLPNKKLKILLVRRGQHPCKGMHALPGGFVKPDETLEEAAYRELQEETGARCNSLRQLRTFSDPNRDPRRRVITCAYTALVDAKSQTIVGGSDAADAEWYDIHLRKENHQEGIWKLTLLDKKSKLYAVLKENSQKRVNELPGLEILDSVGLAFDHALIICYSLLKLREQIKYEPIVFNLLPPLFSLTEAQQAYESILETKLYPQAFRRKIKGFVEETSDFAENRGHRPSKLYKLLKRYDE